MKKVIAILLAVVVVFALAACQPAPAQTSASEAQPEASQAATEAASDASGSKDVADLRLACTLMTMENPYFVNVAAGFQARCEELGIECNVVDGDYDAATQYSVVENFVASNYDGILLSAVDGNGITPLVEQAQEKGIVVLGEAQAVAAADGNYIINDYNYGYNIGINAAAWINEVLGGEAKVLLITEDNVESVKKRGDGMVDAITELAPNAEIVLRQSGCEPDTAMATTESALQAYPDLTVVCCNNDSGAVGAYEAIKAIVKDTSKFYLGGADATAEGLALMEQEGSFFRSTVDIDPYGTGYNAVDILVDYILNGSKGETIYFQQSPVWQKGYEDLANFHEYRTSEGE